MDLYRPICIAPPYKWVEDFYISPDKSLYQGQAFNISDVMIFIVTTQLKSH